MFIATNSLPVRSGHILRVCFWLCGVFALGVVLLTFVVAGAQQQGSDDPTFRKLTNDYCAAWSTGNTDAVAKFYAQDDDLIFFRRGSVFVSRMERICAWGAQNVARRRR